LNRIIIDASIALAWCFPDETSDYADSVLTSLEGLTMLVPAVWSLEVANTILVGERQKRLSQPDIKKFMSLLGSLSQVQDVQPVGGNVNNVLPLAREHNLSAYDAAYLELSIRNHAPLATLDAKLQKAAKKAGVPIFRGNSSQ
jgi:predicted nucleic acid-binding protein